MVSRSERPESRGRQRQPHRIHRLEPADLAGMMAMMPAFATPLAADVHEDATVAVDELHRAVDAIIRDGADLVATTGSFGEFHTLYPEEHATLVRETVRAADGRVPVFAGCLGTHTREVLARCRAAASAGAQGLLVGVPFYFPATIENARAFYRTVASEFADLAIMIYHNPTLHQIHLPTDLVGDLAREHQNVIAMKDSHRDPREFAQLIAAIGRPFSVFVAAWQFDSYAPLGAAGFWSYDCWMDPVPHIRLRDAVRAGDRSVAGQLTIRLHPRPSSPQSLSWRETAAKIAIAKAGYCEPGPLRPPFVIIPTAVTERAEARASSWRAVAEEIRSGAWGPGAENTSHTDSTSAPSSTGN